MKTNKLLLLLALLFAGWQVNAQIIPDLGTAANFGLLSGKKINTADTVYVYGNTGAISTATYLVRANTVYSGSVSAVTTALSDLAAAQSSLSAQTGSIISTSIGSQTFTAGVYQTTGNTTIRGNVILSGDTSSVFIFNIGGDLTIDTAFVYGYHRIFPSKVFWNVSGKVRFQKNTHMMGVVLGASKIKSAGLVIGECSLLCSDTIVIANSGSSTSHLLNASTFFSPALINKNAHVTYDDSQCPSPNLTCNTIINPSFEDFRPLLVSGGYQSFCPDMNDEIYFACNWDATNNPLYPNQSWGTPTGNYYAGNPELFADGTGCTSQTFSWEYSVPINNYTYLYGSGQYPHTGHNYAGIEYSFKRELDPENDVPPFTVYKDYYNDERLEKHLPAPLTANKVYYMEFYSSLSDLSNTTTKLSVYPAHTSTNPNYVGPPVYDASPVPFLTSASNISVGWTKVSGCVTTTASDVDWLGIRADYATTPTAVTPADPTIFVSYPSSSPGYYSLAYFFLDDFVLRPLADAGPDQLVLCNANVTVGDQVCSPISGATYAWTAADVFTGANSTIATPAGMSTGLSFSNVGTFTYDLTVTYGSCSATDQVVLTVASPTIGINASHYVCNDTLRFTAVASPATGLTYAWAVTDAATGNPLSPTITGGTTASPVIDFTGINQNANVCLTVTWPSGCTSTTCTLVYPCCVTPSGTTKYFNTTFSSNTTIIGTSTQKYQFGGVITVASGVLLSISAADVTMDPGTVILLGNNSTLSIQNSWLHACNAMWKGILGTTAHTIRIEDSRIEDAIRAIVDSTGGGEYNIWGNYFNKNLYGVYAKGMNTTAGYQFYNNLFTCSQLPAPTWSAYASVTPNLTNASTLGAYSVDYLLPPYQGAQSIDGITLSAAGLSSATNSMMPIGIATAGSENVFDKLQIGVHTTRSNTLVQNNVFQNISAAINPGTQVGGVYNFGTISLCFGCTTPSVQVGGSSSLKNTFIDNDYGVYSTQKAALTISSNTLTGQGTGIYITGNNANYGVAGGNGITVNQNKLIQCDAGVVLLDNVRGTADITENRFDNSSSTVGTYADNFAILCAEGTLSTNPSNFPYYNIYNNYIDGYYNGIYTAVTFSAQVTDNEVYMRPDNTSNHFQSGIQFVNTNDAYIYNNIVGMSSLNSNNYWQIGILSEFNTVPVVHCNNISNLSAGIMVQGSCYTTAGDGFISNAMTNSDYAFWLTNNGEIGDQYFNLFSTHYSADNQWSGTTYYDTYVTGNSNLTTAPSTSGPSVLYTRSSSPYNISSFDPPVFTGGIGNPLTGINTSGIIGMCNNNTATPAFKASSAELIDKLLMQHGRDIAGDSLVYGDNGANLRRINREGLLRNIVLQDIDPMADSALCRFWKTVAGENVYRFHALDSLIQLADSSSLPALSAQNAAVQPADGIDQSRQAFNALYLQVLAGDTLNASDIAALEALARQCPNQYGTAVFQARSLAYAYTHKAYHSDCEVPVIGGDPQGKVSAPHSSTSDVIIYPNPANTEVYVDMKGYEQLSLQVYNIIGELILQKNVGNKQPIDVKSLSPGTYIYRLYSGATAVKTGKLMISK